MGFETHQSNAAAAEGGRGGSSSVATAALERSAAASAAAALAAAAVAAAAQRKRQQQRSNGGSGGSVSRKCWHIISSKNEWERYVFTCVLSLCLSVDAPPSEAPLGLFGGEKKSQNKNFDDHISII